MGINFKKPVPTPEEIREQYKVPQNVVDLKAKRDQEKFIRKKRNRGRYVVPVLRFSLIFREFYASSSRFSRAARPSRNARAPSRRSSSFSLSSMGRS